MKILSIVRAGPVGTFRIGCPMAQLRNLGHQVLEVCPDASQFSQEQVAELIRETDLLVLQQPSGRFEDRAAALREMRGALVVESDDDLFAWEHDPVQTDPLQVALDKSYAKEGVLAANAADFETWLRGADLVTTTTSPLAEVFREHGARDVAVCPNGMLLEWTRKTARPTDLCVCRGKPAAEILKKATRRGAGLDLDLNTKRVGWTGGVVHRADLDPLLRAMRTVLADASVEAFTISPLDWKTEPAWKDFRPHPKALRRFCVVQNGEKVYGIPFALPHPSGRVIWTYYSALEAVNADVAVIPLRDSPLNRCKSDVTLLSWAIQDVPVVCSRTGPYAQAEKDGFPAVYVDHEDVGAWTRAIQDLLYDRAKARELGHAALEWVLAKRCYPQAGAPWAEAYARVARAKGVAEDLP